MYDPATPTRAAYADYTIYVLRNLNSPIINQTLYQVTLYDVDPVGMRVLMINATDADNVSFIHVLNILPYLTFQTEKIISLQHQQRKKNLRLENHDFMFLDK